MKPFTYTKGPRTGTTVNHQRCLLLVPDKQYEMFVAFREQFDSVGGMRGKVFNVRRKDEQRSSKIGTTWTPAGEMTDEEMLERFEESAAEHGLPLADYVKPFDYEVVLSEFTDEEMAEAAQNVANFLGIRIDGSGETTPIGSSDEEESEEEIEF